MSTSLGDPRRSLHAYKETIISTSEQQGCTLKNSIFMLCFLCILTAPWILWDILFRFLCPVAIFMCTRAYGAPISSGIRSPHGSWWMLPRQLALSPWQTAWGSVHCQPASLWLPDPPQSLQQQQHTFTSTEIQEQLNNSFNFMFLGYIMKSGQTNKRLVHAQQ